MLTHPPVTSFRFQSTLPMKGATYIAVESISILVSIHAPNEGSDFHFVQISIIPFCFNPRSQGRERLSSRSGGVPLVPFNPRSQ